jgi:hypothetical protein
VEAYFSALSKRQTMLLLTALTYGQQDAVQDFEHLPPEEGAVLKHRAQEILQIPREKRIPLLVNEIKKLITARRGALWAADPDRLTALLQKERPALTEVVLRALPAVLAEQIRKKLPPLKVRLTRDVRPEILNIIRWKLELALTHTHAGKVGFKFSDMLLLKSRELITLVDRMGARALATSLAALPDDERERFVSQLAPDQKQLVLKATAAAASRKREVADARDVLVRYEALKGAANALRNAGTQRIALACVAQSHEFAARMVERHPGELGRLLREWILRERPKVTAKGDYGRTDIVDQLERLAAKGVIDRPVRLPPPPKREIDAPPSGAEGLPGGRVLLPPPRTAGPPSPPPRAPMGRLAAPGAPRRDLIAEREARKLAEARRGDPVAAREARKAGHGLADRRSLPDVGREVLPEESAPRLSAFKDRPVSAPIVQKPPVRKPLPGSPGLQGTAVERKPRVVDGRTGSRGVYRPPGRGPKGGSG